jgi:hypothetical protein
VQRFVREDGSRFDPQRGTIRLPVAAPQMPPTPLGARFLRGAAGFGHGGAVQEIASGRERSELEALSHFPVKRISG